MSAGYRFYLLGGHIAAVRDCECTSDADALLEADQFLQSSANASVEV